MRVKPVWKTDLVGTIRKQWEALWSSPARDKDRDVLFSLPLVELYPIDDKKEAKPLGFFSPTLYELARVGELPIQQEERAWLETQPQEAGSRIQTLRRKEAYQNTSFYQALYVISQEGGEPRLKTPFELAFLPAVWSSTGELDRTHTEASLKRIIQSRVKAGNLPSVPSKMRVVEEYLKDISAVGLKVGKASAQSLYFSCPQETRALEDSVHFIVQQPVLFGMILAALFPVVAPLITGTAVGIPFCIAIINAVGVMTHHWCMQSSVYFGAIEAWSRELRSLFAKEFYRGEVKINIPSVLKTGLFIALAAAAAGTAAYATWLGVLGLASWQIGVAIAGATLVGLLPLVASIKYALQQRLSKRAAAAMGIVSILAIGAVSAFMGSFLVDMLLTQGMTWLTMAPIHHYGAAVIAATLAGTSTFIAALSAMGYFWGLNIVYKQIDFSKEKGLSVNLLKEWQQKEQMRYENVKRLQGNDNVHALLDPIKEPLLNSPIPLAWSAAPSETSERLSRERAAEWKFRELLREQLKEVKEKNKDLEKQVVDLRGQSQQKQEAVPLGSEIDKERNAALQREEELQKKVKEMEQKLEVQAKENHLLADNLNVEKKKTEALTGKLAILEGRQREAMTKRNQSFQQLPGLAPLPQEEGASASDTKGNSCSAFSGMNIAEKQQKLDTSTKQKQPLETNLDAAAVNGDVTLAASKDAAPSTFFLSTRSRAASVSRLSLKENVLPLSGKVQLPLKPPSPAPFEELAPAMEGVLPQSENHKAVQAVQVKNRSLLRQAIGYFFDSNEKDPKDAQNDSLNGKKKPKKNRNNDTNTRRKKQRASS